MNILFVDQYGDMGGAQQCLLELIPAIQDREWGAFAALPAPSDFATRLTAMGVAVDPISLGEYSSGKTKGVSDLARFVWDSPQLAMRLRSIIRQREIDVIYVNGARVLVPAALAAGRRLPVVFHAHNYLVPGPGRKLVHASLGFCGWPYRIAVSRFVAGYLGDSSEVIPNGVADLSNGRVVGTTPRIGIVGRIAPEKGHLDFVEAARLLPRDWEFQIAGAPIISAPGYIESVTERANGLPVKFLGWQEDLHRLYSQFDLLIVPSEPGEGFGRVIIEAFSAGVPVVAYESGGIAELIVDNVTGYIVRPQTPQALAERIRTAMHDAEGRARVAREARKLWETNYTIQHYRDRVTKVIARAASNASRAAASKTGR